VENQQYSDSKDLALFLYELGIGLKKEGHSLQALAKIWFSGEGEEFEILRLFGINISKMGKELLISREHLCNTCKTKEIATSIKLRKE